MRRILIGVALFLIELGIAFGVGLLLVKIANPSTALLGAISLSKILSIIENIMTKNRDL
jgi:hypothetical protein